MDRALARLGRAIARLGRAIARLSRAIARLGCASARLDCALARLSGALTRLSGAIARLRCALARLSRAIARLRCALAWLGRALARLSGAIARLSRAPLRLGGALLARLSCALARLGRARTRLSRAIARLRCALARLSRALARLGRALARLGRGCPPVLAAIGLTLISFVFQGMLSNDRRGPLVHCPMGGRKIGKKDSRWIGLRNQVNEQEKIGQDKHHPHHAAQGQAAISNLSPQMPTQIYLTRDIQSPNRFHLTHVGNRAKCLGLLFLCPLIPLSQEHSGLESLAEIGYPIRRGAEPTYRQDATIGRAQHVQGSHNAQQPKHTSCKKPRESGQGPTLDTEKVQNAESDSQSAKSA